MITMTHVRLILVTISLLPNAALGAQSKQSGDQTAPLGSISGRVTIGGRPAPGSTVMLTENEHGSSSSRGLISKALTDQEGHFRLPDVASGRYDISAFAPAYAVKSGVPAITVADGEHVEGVDIDLIPGGVITGRVTLADGRPAMGEQIGIFRVDSNYQRDWSDRFDISADDRGVYRVYGLEPGRYLIGAGINIEHWSRLQRRRYNPLTYHPSTTDPASARVIEVASGVEVTAVDITLADPVKVFTASGCVVDGETGLPVSAARLELEKIHKTATGESSGSSGGHAGSTDAAGCFRIMGLGAGNFNVKAALEGANSYSEVAHFEIKDQDVDGLKVKLHKGGSIIGIVLVEGEGGHAAELPSGLHIWPTSPGAPPATVAPDGSFRAVGLRPGTVRLHLSNSKNSTGLMISRIQHPRITTETREPGVIDGVVQLEPGEQVQDVRIFVSRVTGGVRGRVKVTGGKLPIGSQLEVTLWRPSGTPGSYSGSRIKVDPNGNFEFLGLPPNEYRLEAQAVLPDSAHGSPRQLGRAAINVTVGRQVEEVEIVIDLSKTDK